MRYDWAKCPQSKKLLKNRIFNVCSKKVKGGTQMFFKSKREKSCCIQVLWVGSAGISKWNIAL